MAAASIITLTQENFAEEVLKSSTPVLVDFWGERCPPCLALAPILDELADQYQGRVKIGKVKIDDQQALADEYRVRVVPTMLLFKQGQVADQITGLKSKRDIKASFDRLVV
jgi:thioredoxin 1